MSCCHINSSLIDMVLVRARAVLATYREVCDDARRPARLTTPRLLALQPLGARLTCSASYYDAQRWSATLRALECGRAMRHDSFYSLLVALNEAFVVSPKCIRCRARTNLLSRCPAHSNTSSPTRRFRLGKAFSLLLVSYRTLASQRRRRLFTAILRAEPQPRLRESVV